MARRPKESKLASNERLRDYVPGPLGGHKPPRQQAGAWTSRFASSVGATGTGLTGAGPSAWSPEQISNRLEADFPHDESMRISHEAIYQSLYVQGRGALKRELVACLRTGRALRVPRAAHRWARQEVRHARRS